MSQNRNLEIDSCDKKNSATALWDKNLKFPSTQVCPLLSLFFADHFMSLAVTLCNFMPLGTPKYPVGENNSC